MSETPQYPGTVAQEVSVGGEQGLEISRDVADRVGAFSHELADQLGLPPDRLSQAFMDTIRQELQHTSSIPPEAQSDMPSDRTEEEQSPDKSAERVRTVETILATPGVSMALYGKYGSGVAPEAVVGYYDDTMAGTQAHWATDGYGAKMTPRGHANMPFFQGRRALVETIEGMLPPFEGVVAEKTSPAVPGEPTAFSLTYVDTESGDQRPGVTTTCTVVLPSDTNETIDAIRSDPSLMIDLMRRVFPKADRSNDKLRITDNPAKAHLKAIVNRQGTLTLVWASFTGTQ